jgi:hypothetical protein
MRTYISLRLERARGDIIATMRQIDSLPPIGRHCPLSSARLPLSCVDARVIDAILQSNPKYEDTPRVLFNSVNDSPTTRQPEPEDIRLLAQLLRPWRTGIFA